MKPLYSRVHAQVDDVVPPVCRVGSRALMGKRDFQLCAGTDRFYQSHEQEIMDVSKPLGQGVLGLCHVLESVPSTPASSACLGYCWW